MAFSPAEIYLSKVFEIGISRSTLKHLLNIAGRHQNIALIGWSDYAKHLINVYPDRIKCIVDEKTEVTGLSFRDVPVVPFSSKEARSADCYLATRFDMLTSAVLRLYQDRQFPTKRYLFAPEYDGRTSEFYDPMMQDAIFETIRSAGSPPPTMMEDSRIVLLVEVLRTALRVEGDVVEIGSWQGGSSWYICQALKALNEDRRAYFFDLFDESERMSGRAVMASDHIRRQLSFYPNTSVVVGDVRETITALEDRRIAFFHYDNMFQHKVFPYVWSRMPSGGMILLDNYGHFRSHPAMIDDFAEKNGTRVTFIPPLGQGILIKP
ncbi:class I SAM-dependent methyltransferase [Jiella pelagia]|uniref:Class I SAM-dependent methyltransferase n=1 Tax=Jiella pelagia TaxID=2986949 RepID=A0ABY7C1E5_9HYPH|nr:class I SAM-dependent methyltransferase [Jiella pelagia]WAP68854.1 class I SAM-dependent methyltransferase [Jiella pelagia]